MVNGIVDRESIAFYPLLLTISDYGNPQKSINISISIEVLDENDHCPQLHIETSFIMINRDITRKIFVMHLIASDNDQGANGKLSFELSPLTSHSFINLYPNGTLFIQLDSKLIQDDALIVLHVQIRDHGQPIPCLIVEVLRFFIGSNRTDWLTIFKKNNNYNEASLVRMIFINIFHNINDILIYFSVMLLNNFNKVNVWQIHIFQHQHQHRFL